MILRTLNGNVYFETMDGEEKVFRLDFNAIADLEALLGKGIASLISEDNIGFNIIRGFYWAGLKHKDKGMTVQKAGNFVQSELSKGRSIEDLMIPVTEALIASGIVDRAEVEEEIAENEDDGDGEKN